LASLKAQKNDQSTVLTLNDPVFRVGGSELQPGAFSDIDKIATYLKGHPDRTIVVSGYTDNTGSATYNQGLSERRADAVKNALIARGVEPSRIVAHGFGPSAPRAPNDTVAGRQLNRRVEVVVAGPSGQAARAPEMNSQQVSPGVGSTVPQPPR